jgi:hypothetical protein
MEQTATLSGVFGCLIVMGWETTGGMYCLEACCLFLLLRSVVDVTARRNKTEGIIKH